MGQYFGDWCRMVISGVVAIPFTGVLQAHQPTISLCICWDYHHRNGLCIYSFPKGASLIGPVKSSLLASIEPISARYSCLSDYEGTVLAD